MPARSTIPESLKAEHASRLFRHPVHNGVRCRLWPAGAYAITILYHPVLSFLTEANPTTDLLDNHPDLYFHGAMLYAHGYVKDDPRAAQFKALWDEALEEAKRYFTRQVFSTSLKPQVAFVP